MTRHPLLLAALTTDALVFLLLLGAAAVAFDIARRWDPEDTRMRQLRLQARSETATLAVAWAFGLYLFATVVLIYAITNILPDIVPGAMCGTGVLQAMRSGGPRMLIYRLVVVAIFWVWWRLEKVNQSLPEAPLVSVNARLVLLLLPACGLALHASWQALQAMDLQQPVDCCAVIYDQVDALGETNRTMGIGNAFWAAAFGVITLGLAAGALIAWQRPTRRWPHYLLAALAIGWLPIAAIALVRTLAAYHYGVLHHYCPWCLFLPLHHLAGFPIWASWLLVGLETTAALVLSSRFGGLPPTVPVAAGEQAAKAARNTLLAMLLFVLLTVGPVVWWRLRYGVWLTG